MKEVEFYRKNEIDCYAFFYFSDTKTAEAIHIIIPVIGGSIGCGKSVVTLENIENRKEAIKKLKKTVDKF